MSVPSRHARTVNCADAQSDDARNYDISPSAFARQYTLEADISIMTT